MSATSTTPSWFTIASWPASNPSSGVYKAPCHFTGKTNRVTVDVTGDLIKNDEAEVMSIMAKQ